MVVAVASPAAAEHTAVGGVASPVVWRTAFVEAVPVGEDTGVAEECTAAAAAAGIDHMAATVVTVYSKPVAVVGCRSPVVVAPAVGNTAGAAVCWA